MASGNISSGGESPKRKQATLYDAVAGRVGYEGFLTEQQPSRYRDRASTASAPISADEVLFRRVGAPARYEEDDVYAADRHLRPDQQLPDSDLLKEIHAYVADFYSAATNDDGEGDFRSMDETALLAIGILLEEAAAAGLGKSGDLALVEAPEQHDLQCEEDGLYFDDGRWKRKVIPRLRGRGTVIKVESEGE